MAESIFPASSCFSNVFFFLGFEMIPLDHLLFRFFCLDSGVIEHADEFAPAPALTNITFFKKFK
jgi:hypothetical protein